MKSFTAESCVELAFHLTTKSCVQVPFAGITSPVVPEATAGVTVISAPLVPLVSFIVYSINSAGMSPSFVIVTLKLTASPG